MSEETIRARARETYGSDDLQIDDDAMIRPTGDGAWVQAWGRVPAAIFVTAADPIACERCGVEILAGARVEVDLAFQLTHGGGPAECDEAGLVPAREEN